jgi:hypothetical protein
VSALAKETSQDSGESEKSEKSDKPAKKGHICQSRLRLSNGWGSAYSINDPQLSASLKALHGTLLSIIGEADPVQACSLVDKRMALCGNTAAQLGNQPNPRTPDGALMDHKLYYYVLPDDRAELAILLPPHGELRTTGISLYVRCVRGPGVEQHLSRLLTVLSGGSVD